MVSLRVCNKVSTALSVRYLVLGQKVIRHVAQIQFTSMIYGPASLSFEDAS